MDWRDKRLTIRLWYRDLAERRPVLAFVLVWGPIAAAVFSPIFLFAYLDIAAANTESSPIENILGALFYAMLLILGYIALELAFPVIALLFLSLEKLVIRYVWRPIRAVFGGIKMPFGISFADMRQSFVRWIREPKILDACAFGATVAVWSGVWLLTGGVSVWGTLLTLALLMACMRAIRGLGPKTRNTRTKTNNEAEDAMQN